MSKSDYIKRQIEQCRADANKVWKIYIDEMRRLTENTDAQPDSSVFEIFDEGLDGTFVCELAKLFKDAIEFGYIHTEFAAEV